jgi:hypothetical protein
MQSVKNVIMNDNKSKSWILEVQQDPNNQDELILEFPPEMLELAGWKEGDTLIWSINSDDSVSLHKKVD